jgi:hypothetical protein
MSLQGYEEIKVPHKYGRNSVRKALNSIAVEVVIRSFDFGPGDEAPKLEVR